MQVDKKETYTIIRPEDDCDQRFFSSLKKQIFDFYEEHLIIDFTTLGTVEVDDILQFFDIAIEKRTKHTSFVLVASGLAIDEIPDNLIVVPTLKEAQDVLEMDAIERDLMGL